jgi:hypothetical protein
MVITRTIIGVLSLLIIATAPAFAAQSKKPAAKPRGKTETLACRLGTEDRHARIAVVVIGGRTDSFAYYSKWKPRTCSIYLQRNRDMYSKWADSGAITTVNLDKGAFLIEHKPGEYHFIFRDIDRERYCGMDGVINGSLTIKRGSDQCVLNGDIMVEGTPLGEANRFAELPPPAAGASDVPEAIASPAALKGPAQPPQVAKPQAAPAAPVAQPAVKPEAKPEAAAIPAAKPEAPTATAKPEAPATTAKPDAPATTATPETPATTAKPETKEEPRAAAQEEPRAGAKGEVTAKPAPPSPPTEQPAEASGNPFRAFFRSIAPGTKPEQPSP